MVRSAALLLAGMGLLAAAPAGAAGHTYYLTGNPADVRPATSGGLLLMGGGGDVDDAFRWFVRQAGGGDLVVLRASGGDGYHAYASERIGGIDSVETIVFHDRSAASDPEVLRIIAQADGLWLAGGDQSRYVRFWQDTPVQTAIREHVRAGKPLGGTSAGLAVLGQHAFAALESGTVTSDVALRDPFDRRITLVSDFLGPDLLRGVLTDSHFTPRARLGRSLVFLARLMTDASGDRLLGIGVDEKTALAIEADGSARVMSADPAGRVWLLLPTRAPDVLKRGEPLTWRDVRVVALGPSSRLHLPTLAIEQPAAVERVAVERGRLSALR